MGDREQRQKAGIRSTVTDEIVFAAQRRFLKRRTRWFLYLLSRLFPQDQSSPPLLPTESRWVPQLSIKSGHSSVRSWSKPIGPISKPCMSCSGNHLQPFWSQRAPSPSKGNCHSHRMIWPSVRCFCTIKDSIGTIDLLQNKSVTFLEIRRH